MNRAAAPHADIAEFPVARIPAVEQQKAGPTAKLAYWYFTVDDVSSVVVAGADDPAFSMAFSCSCAKSP